MPIKRRNMRVSVRKRAPARKPSAGKSQLPHFTPPKSRPELRRERIEREIVLDFETVARLRAERLQKSRKSELKKLREKQS